MVESLLKFITSENLFSQEDELLLAISGGIDSMVMAQLFLNAGIPFSIAHVNYNLRGDDSVKDRDFVVQWAKSHDVMIYIKEVDQSEYDGEGSIQMLAREIRYSFFESLMMNHGYTRLATAHHLDDSFETVLLNLVKGTGPSGLKGIPVKNDYIIRPMMFTRRTEIKAYAEQYDVIWREDSSNEKINYQRNQIRHLVTPLLWNINPSLLETFQDTQLRSMGSIELIDEVVSDIRDQYLTKSANYQELGTDWVKDDKKSLLVLSEIVADFGLNFRQAKDLFACVLERRSGKMVSSASHVLNVDRNRIIITAVEETDFEEVSVQIGVGEVVVSSEIFLLEELAEVDTFNLGNNVVVLDSERVEWPLKIRKWRQGDWFVPLGMSGKKMVSDFMIDSKIPVSLKKDMLVVESAGDIVWLVGHRLDDRFKVKDSTRKLLKITWTHA